MRYEKVNYSILLVTLHFSNSDKVTSVWIKSDVALENHIPVTHGKKS